MLSIGLQVLLVVAGFVALPLVLFIYVKLVVFAYYSAKHAAKKHYENEAAQ